MPPQPHAGAGGPGQLTSFPSAEVIAELARERRSAQMQELDSLDTKAATLLGFGAVILGLLFTSRLATEGWGFLLSVAAGFLGGSAIPLGFAIWPRQYRFNPNIAALNKLAIRWPPAATHRAVIASVSQAIAHNQRILRWKARAVRVGAAMIVIGVLIAGGRLVYSAETSSANAHQGHEGKTRQRSIQ